MKTLTRTPSLPGTIIALALLLALGITSNAQIYVAYSSRLDPMNSGNIGAFNFDGSPINATLIPGLNYPWGLTADADGNLYVANRGMGAIGQYTASGATVNPALISAGPVMGVALDGKGFLYTINDWGVFAKYTTSGTLVDSALITGFPRGGFGAVASDGTYLYVANSYHRSVGKYTTSGQLVDAALITLPANTGPIGLAVDRAGNLYVARNDNIVSKYTTSGAVLNSALISSGLDQPFAIALDGAGKLYVANQRSGSVGVYTTDGVIINPALISGLDEPLGLVIVPEPASSALALMSFLLIAVARRCGRARS